jgi:hypothetical protein
MEVGATLCGCPKRDIDFNKKGNPFCELPFLVYRIFVFISEALK